MAHFQIKANTKVEVWQEVVYQVEADTEEEAQAKINKTPLEYSTGYNTLEETEKVLEIDFENFGNGKNITEL